MTVDIELLPLYAELQGHPKIEIIKHYARANVARAVEKWRESVDRAFDDIRELRHEVAAKDAEIEDLVKANEQVQKLALDVLADRDELKAEIESLRAKTAMTMGVGTGDGKLFVHGDYDSVKAAQALVFRAERMGEALRELSQCDGSPANVLNAEVLAGRVRSIATKALLDHDREAGNGQYPW